MSLILAFDTATDHVALALGRVSDSDVEVVLERDFEAPRASLSRLLPEVEEKVGAAYLIGEAMEKHTITLTY